MNAAMKVDVIELDGKAGKKIEPPSVFGASLRPDLIRRSFWLVDSHRIQPKGRDPMAGMKTSAETSNPPTGHGISRIPRVKGERYSRSGLAGGVASVVKGRLAHPPKAEKVIYLKINRKERRLALASAVAYTADKEAVMARGHKIKKIDLPLVVSDDVESIAKTSELVDLMEKLDLKDELKRLYDGVKRRSGKSRLRGRSYRERVGPLVIVTNDRGVGKAAESIPGLEVARVSSLGITQLAPGGVPGRLALWSESSLTGLAVSGEEGETRIAA